MAPPRKHLSRKCKLLKEKIQKRRSGKKGQPRATLTHEEAAHIFQMRLKCCRDVADLFGVAPKTVRDIWNRRTWTHVTDSMCGDEAAGEADPPTPAVHCCEDVLVQQPQSQLFEVPESDCHSVAAASSSSLLGDDDDDNHSITGIALHPAGMPRFSALDYDHELAFY